MAPGGEGLPRSYLVKQCKNDMNKLCHVSRTPGTAEGAQMDFNTELEKVIKIQFLLLMLGMKHATSDYACIWCTIHKKDRYDMSKPQDYYWGECFARTLQHVKDCAKAKKLSCEHQPLLEIPLENIVLDELHLMLRVTDKLTKNLVLHAIEWDKKDKKDNKRPCERTNRHLKDLAKAIVSCGVTFNVWEKMDADGKASGLYDFTSLMGPDKKLLLKYLPAKLIGVIKPDVCDTEIKIWKDFDEIYLLVSKSNPKEEQVLDYFIKSRNWMNIFLSLGGKMQGHEKARAAPYMHGMVYHIPRFMTLHKGIKKFTGQGVKKLNDDCRRIHLRRSNKWEAAKDVLLVGKRLENLQEFERFPRQYTKRYLEYWENTIRDNRAKRGKTSTEASEDKENSSPSSPAIENMTAEEIKAKLSSLGIKTRLRSLQKLQELLTNTLQEKENEMH